MPESVRTFVKKFKFIILLVGWACMFIASPEWAIVVGALVVGAILTILGLFAGGFQGLQATAGKTSRLSVMISLLMAVAGIGLFLYGLYRLGVNVIGPFLQ